jgi:hypothetical protein
MSQDAHFGSIEEEVAHDLTRLAILLYYCSQHGLYLRIIAIRNELLDIVDAHDNASGKKVPALHHRGASASKK